MAGLVRRVIVVTILALLPTPVWAQTGLAAASDDVHRTAGMRLPGPSLDQSQSQARRGDPLWNGVLAGAAVGAMIGAFGGHALLDCDGCSTGFNVPLTFGVLGAGVGAGIGAGIDALRDRQTRARGLTPGLTPVFGPAKRGLVLWLRF